MAGIVEFAATNDIVLETWVTVMDEVDTWREIVVLNLDSKSGSHAGSGSLCT
jgi:hypothetical protein